jgi:hypothetical protein
MTHDHETEFEASLIGRSCVVERREHDWSFDLSGGVGLGVSAPWRIGSDGRIAFASEDDGQMFGLTSPLDGEAEARKLLGSKVIAAAKLDRETADLKLHFDASTRVDVFNNSRGYEGWQARYAIHDKRWLLIAMGGGHIAIINMI